MIILIAIIVWFGALMDLINPLSLSLFKILIEQKKKLDYTIEDSILNKEFLLPWNKYYVQKLSEQNLASIIFFFEGKSYFR